MPELPEVETLRRGLERHLVGRTIRGGLVAQPQMLKGSVLDPPAFVERLVGEEIVGIRRRGKHLIFDLLSGYHLLFHLKMRGQIVVVPSDVPIEKYHALTLRFDDPIEMRFYDMWRWGEFRLAAPADLEAHEAISVMGREPLSSEWTAEHFASVLRSRRQVKVKAALLDQSVVAGVGNIYADESLFRSGIHPERKASSLSDDEVNRLHESVRTVLHAATEGGGTLSDEYVDADGLAGRYTPLVYDRAGKPCPQCGTALERIKVAGRGTAFCPVCQQ